MYKVFVHRMGNNTRIATYKNKRSAERVSKILNASKKHEDEPDVVLEDKHYFIKMEE